MKPPSTALIRAAIAIMVVGTFMVITAVLALFPLFSNSNVELGAYSDFFAKSASVYTGIVGVIIGYYFARRSDKPPAPSDEPPARTEPGAPPGG